MAEPTPKARQRTQTQQSTSIRSKLNEQLNRLQGKHTAEMDLLEDIKVFTKQRAEIERQSAQNLLRLTNQFINKREAGACPELPGFPRIENRGLVEIWKHLLEKTADLAKHKQTIADLLQNQIAEKMRQQRRVKEANFKKLIEIAQKMNSEILESIKEATTSRKSYCETEKVCEDARIKFTEAETRLKKKDVKFFESVSSLEKTHKKCSDRLKACQKRTTVARNDYLLSLSTTNAHLQKHATKDFPQIMLAMDGEVYDKFRDAYALFAQIELDCASYTKANFEDLREQASLVNRDYVVECFFHKHPLLKETISVNFEPYGQDPVSGLSRDHGAEIFLDKDARKWATKLTKDQQAIATVQKHVKGLQSVTSAYTKNPEFGTSDAQAEAQQQIDTKLEEVRHLEVLVTKAEARLEGLRGAGIDVNKWLQKAGDSYKNDHLQPSTLASARASQLSLTVAGGSQEFDVETASIQSGQIGSEFDSLSIGSVKSDYPKYCVVLYHYKAQREDELDVSPEEELEILEWDDGDGWCKGKNKLGKEGYFPQSYVQPSSRSSSPPSGPPAQHQDSVSTINSVSTLSSINMSSSVTAPSYMNGSVSEGRKQLRAIYEYTAQFDEELSFPEGAMIELIRTDDNGVDDGWWEGRYKGKVGVFPSVVVELLSDGAETPPNPNDITAIHVPPPPCESPPPISPADLHGGSTGTSPVRIPNTNHHGNRWPPTSSPLGLSTTPSWRVEIPTPNEEGHDHTWRLDSFDEFDDEDSSIV